MDVLSVIWDSDAVKITSELRQPIAQLVSRYWGAVSRDSDRWEEGGQFAHRFAGGRPVDRIVARRAGNFGLLGQYFVQ